MTFWHGFGRMIPRSLDRGSLLNNQRRAQIHLPRFSARASKSALQGISVTPIIRRRLSSIQEGFSYEFFSSCKIS